MSKWKVITIVGVVFIATAFTQDVPKPETASEPSTDPVSKLINDGPVPSPPGFPPHPTHGPLLRNPFGNGGSPFGNGGTPFGNGGSPFGDGGPIQQLQGFREKIRGVGQEVVRGVVDTAVDRVMQRQLESLIPTDQAKKK